MFDQETELYYLQSRYYDPQIGRFINADALVSTGQGLLGNNMFAYCLNYPVGHVDVQGYLATAFFDESDDKNNPFDDVGKHGGGNSNSTAAGTLIGGGSGFRRGLQQTTGQSGSGCDAHHIFPQKYSDQFNDLGINNHNPQYGSWWDSSAHRQSSYEYNLWWDEFFKTPGVTSEDAFSLVEFLSYLFGFDLNY